MKFTFLLLVVVIACSKQPGSSQKNTAVPNRVTDPDTIVDIADPLTTPDTQQQEDGDFQLERNYNGVNVVLNHNSRRHVGLIRIKDKDAEKLHKHMALKTMKIDSPNVKSEIEAKVGKHVMCRTDICWVYIDYKNGDVRENDHISDSGKAPKLIRNFRGKNLDLFNDVDVFGLDSDPMGRIHFDGVDAKALYSVMALAEVEGGSKGSATSKKTGEGITCTRSLNEKTEQTVFRCEVNFNHRSGALKGAR